MLASIQQQQMAAYALSFKLKMMLRKKFGCWHCLTDGGTGTQEG